MDATASALRATRRHGYFALGVAFTHLVFGAIVRISGSGMGCGDNWPRCYGHWFPPFDRIDLQIEWTHRLLASILVLTVLSFWGASFARRATPGIGGRGGVLRAATLAAGAVLAAALLGALTVKLGNPPFATVAHWSVAMTLFATLGAAVIRAGGMGGTRVVGEAVTPRARRAAFAAAALAGVVVAMGGLTAKYPSAAIACRAFPACGRDAAATAGAVHVQLTHRTLAMLLVLHLIGTTVALARRRDESRVVARASAVAMTLGLAQIAVAAAMVILTLPAPLRSLHEAVGVSVWLAAFTFAYLARRAGRLERAAVRHGAEGGAALRAARGVSPDGRIAAPTS